MKRPLPRLAVTAAALIMAALFFTTSPAIQAQDPEVTQLLIAQLDKLSGPVMFILARELGVTEIRGKSLNQQGGTHNSPKRLVDVPIANIVLNEEQPALATSPKNKKLLVEGNHVFDAGAVRCEARHSSDGGMTWSAPVLMPQEGESCANPVLAYAPDGRRVYYAYMDMHLATTDFDIVVSYSDNNGATWSQPSTALEGIPGTFYDKPWIGTPDDDPLILYVTATRFDRFGADGCRIVFTQSPNGGTAYTPPKILDSSLPGCDPLAPFSPIVQGARPSGGKFGNVVVAWYHSGLDGAQNGSFEIRIRRSADFGATFGPVVVAATDSSETSFFKGPFDCYHVWWTSMFPDVEIDASGSAHIAYTYDPVPGNATPEEGDIRYVTSGNAPYTVWSAPVTVNDDRTASAQGYVAIDTQTEQTGQSANVHATWMDDRLPPPPGAASQCLVGIDVENLYYDIFYSRKPPGEGWKPNNRISDTSSLSDFFFVGDRIELSVDNGSLFTIWTDGRDKTTIFDDENDVWGSRTHLTQ